MISYTKGITHTPGDLLSEDGELMECVNLKSEHGELRPFLWPSESFTLGSNEELLYIHKGSGFKNYFYLSDGKLKSFYFDDTMTRQDYAFSHSFDGSLRFDAIGNTVVLLDGGGVIHYILYQQGDYNYLGTHFPECPLSFGLQGEFKRFAKDGNFHTVTFSKSPSYTAEGIILHKETIDSVTNQVLGAVNKFVNEEVTERGKFMFPFFVRYAYRLYDGTLTYHSSPVLMVASSYTNPYVHVKTIGMNGDGDIVSCGIDIATVASSLDYQLIDDASNTLKNELKRWSDIIKSVDIFISSPIYTYNQNSRIERFVLTTEYGTDDASIKSYFQGCYFVGKLTGGDSVDEFANHISWAENGALLLNYQRMFIPELYSFMTKEGVGKHSVELGLSRGEIDSSIKECSTFYLLKSITTDSLSSTRTVIDVSESYLSSLQSRELMTDDYYSHDVKLAHHSFSYNNRLNLTKVSRQLFSGYLPDSLYQYTDGAVKFTFGYTKAGSDVTIDEAVLTDESDKYCRSVQVQIGVDNSGAAVFPVKESRLGKYDMREVGLYTYHPNTNADLLLVGGLIPINPGYIGVYEFETHSGLNGCINYQGLKRREKSDYGSFVDAVDNYIVKDDNKIYTSEVNNPFVFSASGVNTVGTGDVLGIVSTTKALSQGQFGQFPLLVLTTDGVWAMTVNDEGLYSTKQVISREVCNNPNSIVQTDSLVFFTSEKGLMCIDGSSISCVTPQMVGLPKTVTSFKRIGDLLKSVTAIHDITEACDAVVEFVDYLRDCRIGYSYKDSALYISNSSYNFQYLYNLSNGTVTKICKTDEVVSGFINDYPDTLLLGGKITDSVKKVYSMIAPHDLGGDAVYGFAMSRPMKLGNPTAMKRIVQVKNIKSVSDGNSFVKYALWGSNDCLTWYYVGSYNGGFKYYRMGLFTCLRPTESLLGSVIMTEEKRNNKLR